MDNVEIGDVTNWYSVLEREDEFIDGIGSAVVDEIATWKEKGKKSSLTIEGQFNQIDK